MLLRDAFPVMGPKYASLEIRRALTTHPEVKKYICFACVLKQKRVLAYLFPDERGVDWHEEAKAGRTLEWLNKLL